MVHVGPRLMAGFVSAIAFSVSCFASQQAARNL